MSGEYKHYGSIGTMVDYENDIHNLYFTTTFTPVPQLRFTSTVVYNNSTGSYDQVLMPDVSTITVNSNGEPDLTHQDFTFDQMHTYSNLDYQMIQLYLGTEYTVAPGVVLTADGEYIDLNDDAGGYVYGIETGSLFLIRTGVRVEF